MTRFYLKITHVLCKHVTNMTSSAYRFHNLNDSCFQNYFYHTELLWTDRQRERERFEFCKWSCRGDLIIDLEQILTGKNFC